MKEENICVTDGCAYDKAEGYDHCYHCLSEIEMKLLKKMQREKKEEKDDSTETGM